MTVVVRKIKSTPVRSASDVWNIIINLLAPQSDSVARKELLAISGIGSALIADEAMMKAPIVIFGSGPRLRVYCLYNEDAITGEGAKEDSLSFDATAGDWYMSLPVPSEDLAWVQESLKKFSSRVTARDMTTGIDTEKDEDGKNTKIVEVDKEAFLRP